MTQHTAAERQKKTTGGIVVCTPIEATICDAKIENPVRPATPMNR